jgi:tetratricopeptide (TPR) repeat protein
MEEAQTYESKGELVEALEKYKLVITVDPENTAAEEKRIEIEKKLHELAEFRYQAGMSYYRQGKYEQARREFLTALRYNPQHLTAERMLTVEREPVEKLKQYVLHTIQPDETISKLAKLYYGDYKEFHLIAKFNQMDDATIVLPGQKIKVPLIEGLPFYADPEKIITESSMEAGYTQPEGVATDKEAKPTEETPPFQKTKETIPDDQTIEYRGLGIELFNSKNYEDAINEFNKVLNVYPDDKIALEYLSLSYFELGMTAYQQEAYAKAIQSFNEALAYNKDCPDCQTYIDKCKDKNIDSVRGRAIGSYNEKKYPEAITYFEKVLQQNPEDETTREYLSNAHFENGLVLFYKSKYLEARDEFKSAFQYDPSCDLCEKYIRESEEMYKEFHYEEGVRYFNDEKLEDAIKQWEMVSAIDPNFKDVEDQLERARKYLIFIENIKKGPQQ